MKRALQPPVDLGVRVVAERREVEDDAGERELVAAIAEMLDRRRHSRRQSGQ
jgi:hypothetical protein